MDLVLIKRHNLHQFINTSIESNDRWNGRSLKTSHRERANGQEKKGSFVARVQISNQALKVALIIDIDKGENKSSGYSKDMKDHAQ